MCGEKTAREFITYLIQGSPPRMRGKGIAQWQSSVFVRITPACAGKRGCRRTASPQRRDHPRVCGEKLWLAVRNAELMGSPPRMRGKGVVHVFVTEELRITPAYAGKSLRLGNNPSTSWDHPRVCGEKTTQTAPTPVSPISSMARWVTRVPGPSSSTEMPAAGI